jgi:hypothetical protein
MIRRMAGIRWDDTLFDQLQMIGDPLADQVIVQHAATRPGATAASFVKDIAGHLVLPPPKCSPAIDRYLSNRPPLPTWASDDKLRRGTAFFEDHSLQIGMTLFCASLPEAYAAARGARVLGLTKRMTKDPVRRIYETAQMIFDCMGAEGGLHPGEAGYEDVQRVRLMHGAVRYLALNDPSVSPPWDVGDGLPLNQEELLGTLMTFTQVVFEALDRMGVVYDPADAEAYLHSWCVAGHLLGIRPDLLPLTPDDARQITAAIRRRQRRPSADGAALGQALVKALQDSMTVPFLRPLPPALIRWQVGAEVARINGIKGHASLDQFFGAVASASRRINLDARHNPVLSWLVTGVTGHVSRVVLQSFLNAARAEARPQFQLPQSLEAKVARPLPRFRAQLRTVSAKMLPPVVRNRLHPAPTTPPRAT